MQIKIALKFFFHFQNSILRALFAVKIVFFTLRFIKTSHLALRFALDKLTLVANNSLISFCNYESQLEFMDYESTK